MTAPCSRLSALYTAECVYTALGHQGREVLAHANDPGRAVQPCGTRKKMLASEAFLTDLRSGTALKIARPCAHPARSRPPKLFAVVTRLELDAVAFAHGRQQTERRPA